MPESKALQKILMSQREWARRRGIELVPPDRVREVEENLFQPLSEATRKNFEDGAGNELGGDICSLRSSAALVCNVFDYWRSRDLGPIAEACGAVPGADSLCFEKTFLTGLRGTPPHLDVVFEAGSRPVLGIESKFGEHYQPAHNAFAPAYLDSDELWKTLPACKQLARQIHERRAAFVSLGAAQLLKHALGLAHAFAPDRVRLLYLWYEIPGDEATAHRRELDVFSQAVAGDVDFRSLTYQQLFRRLQAQEGEHPQYVAYLRDRYFPDVR